MPPTSKIGVTAANCAQRTKTSGVRFSLWYPPMSEPQIGKPLTPAVCAILIAVRSPVNIPGWSPAQTPFRFRIESGLAAR